MQIAVARLATARNQPAAAARAIDAAIAADPNNIEALQTKSAMLAASADGPGAKTFADRAVAAAPGFAGPLLDRAGLALATGQAAAARADIDAVLRVQPRNATALYLDGVAAVQEGRYDHASEQLGALGGAAGRFGRVPYFEALTALSRNLPSTAVKSAEQYVNRAPDDPDGIRLLARAQAANNRPDLARDTLKAAIARGMDDARTLDLLGSVLASLGDVAGAEDAFRKALAKAPGQPAIETHLAELHIRQGDPARAARDLATVADAGSRQAQVDQARAVAQIAAGEFDQAAATIAALRASSGQTEQVGILAGMLALGRLDVEGAVAAFSETLRSFPDSVTAALDLARAQAASGRRAEARDTIAKVLTRDPRDPSALSSYVQLGIADNQLPAVLRVLDAARTAAPNDDGILAMQADMFVRAGDPTRAVNTLLRSRLPESRSPTIWAAIGRAQAAAGRPRDAMDAFAKALDGAPGPQAALDLADIQIKAGNPAAAASTLDAAITSFPADFDLLTRRVGLEADIASPAQALAKAAALRNDPAQMPTAALLAGDLLVQQNRLPDAVVAYRTEWDASPTRPLTLRLAEAQIRTGDPVAAAQTLKPLPDDADAAMLRARIAMGAGQWPEAARNLERAAKGRPTNSALLNNLAYAYQQIADPRARATAQRAYLLDPTADNADTLGWIMVTGGAAKDALPILSAAARLRPGDAAIAYHLAAALSATGDDTAALPLLTTALASPAAFDGRPAAEQLLRRIKGSP